MKHENKPYDSGYKAGLKKKKEFILGDFKKREADIVWEIALPDYKTYVFVDNELYSITETINGMYRFDSEIIKRDMNYLEIMQ